MKNWWKGYVWVWLLCSLIVVLCGLFFIYDRVSANTGQLQNSAGSMATVAFSATPVFDGNQGRSFKITLTGNVTSSTFVNAIPGQVYHFMVCQDGVGLHSFTWPANFLGVIAISATSVASKCSIQSVVFDGTNAYAPATGMLNL